MCVCVRECVIYIFQWPWRRFISGGEYKGHIIECRQLKNKKNVQNIHNKSSNDRDPVELVKNVYLCACLFICFVLGLFPHMCALMCVLFAWNVTSSFHWSYLFGICHHFLSLQWFKLRDIMCSYLVHLIFSPKWLDCVCVFSIFI